ncbi:hypothetical protein ElyMa_004274300 [Elysia marginata]|uniref:Secreted protein n=1 Tax=Elysia marginata TaxID=1093978 RepID=A0AAV4GW16_9GAST|nr:hypothetical protein ElyMa_004274300 [Elysia marginata]
MLRRRKASSQILMMLLSGCLAPRDSVSLQLCLAPWRVVSVSNNTTTATTTTNNNSSNDDATNHKRIRSGDFS